MTTSREKLVPLEKDALDDRLVEPHPGFNLYVEYPRFARLAPTKLKCAIAANVVRKEEARDAAIQFERSQLNSPLKTSSALFPTVDKIKLSTDESQKKARKNNIRRI